MPRYDLSYNVATGMDGGFLVPIGFQEAVPGDLFRARHAMFLRASPMAKPILHSVMVDVRTFFVPYRLLWSEWEAFRNQQTVGAFPTITMAANQPLIDYLGAQSRVGEVVSALPVRAYNLIVNRKYYQGLPAFVVADRAQDDTSVARALWPNDYYTTARSQPQLGPSEQIPITISAGVIPVQGIGVQGSPARPGGSTTVRQRSPLPDFTVPGAGGQGMAGAWPDAGGTAFTMIRTTGTGASMRPDVTVDLSAISSTTGVALSDLRRAVASQDWKEIRAKYGPDYPDLIRAMGARSSDLRLREPEYLGGGKRRLAFSEVLATGASAGVDVGDMFGHGIATVGTKWWTFYAPEDGCFITIASVRPMGVYANSIPRAFSRITEADFWSPQRAGIGDQVILNKEVYAAHSAPNGIFGYQDRFGDYMRAFDMVTDTMRNVAEMQQWHLARIFSSDPNLNQAFLECNYPTRGFLDATQRNFIVQASHEVSARRPIYKDKAI